MLPKLLAGGSIKKMFLKVSQNSQKSLFFDKIAGLRWEFCWYVLKIMQSLNTV